MASNASQDLMPGANFSYNAGDLRACQHAFKHADMTFLIQKAKGRLTSMYGLNLYSLIRNRVESRKDQQEKQRAK